MAKILIKNCENFFAKNCAKIVEKMQKITEKIVKKIVHKIVLKILENLANTPTTEPHFRQHNIRIRYQSKSRFLGTL